MNTIKIISLDIENVKKVRAVSLAPAADGLTVIGGENGQGKTSVLEGIMGALGGDSYRQQVRDGEARGTVELALSNGIRVKRSYTNGGGSRLEVTDPTGAKSGQQLLNAFVSPFALSVGEFMAVDDKRRVKILLDVIGVNPQPFEERIRNMEQERLVKGRERDRAKGHAESLPFFEEAGDEKLDGAAITERMTEALAHNAKVRQAGNDVKAAEDRLELAARRLEDAREAVRRAQEAQEAAQQAYAEMNAKLADTRKNAQGVGAEMDTATIQEKLDEVTVFNERVASNLSRRSAFDQHGALAQEYKEIQAAIEQERGALAALLEGATLPYPGLTVLDGVMEWNGRRWETLSESERLILSTAVSRAIKPECGFVLIDGLERMSARTLSAFAGWLEANGLQAIGTRVGTDAPGTIIIEDGEIVNDGGNDGVNDGMTESRNDGNGDDVSFG